MAKCRGKQNEIWNSESLVHCITYGTQLGFWGSWTQLGFWGSSFQLSQTWSEIWA